MLRALDLIGVAFFAVSGALAAGRKQLDLLGVVVLAAVTAIGGGTIRDILLDHHPIFWIADASYLMVIVASALITFVAARHVRPPYGLLLVVDALGLALFSVSGAQIAERLGLPAVVVVFMGTITGVAGGAVRDVLSAEIPLVMRSGNLYASAAIAGISLYLVLEAAGLDRTTAAIPGMATVAAIRFAAIAYGLRLPVFEVPADHGERDDR
jgi:uncharacterized membrane protein YeiH